MRCDRCHAPLLSDYCDNCGYTIDSDEDANYTPLIRGKGVIVRRFDISRRKEVVKEDKTQPSQDKAKKKAVRQRRTRSFDHRGYSFFVKYEGETASVYILEESSGKMQYQCTVDRDKYFEAVKALVIISNAEAKILDISVEKSAPKRRHDDIQDDEDYDQ